MTDKNESSDSEDKALDPGRAERRELCPDEGFVVVKIDMMRPPGEALTRLSHHDELVDVSVPESTEWADYVVYDADNNAYLRSDLTQARADAEATDVRDLFEATDSTDRRAQRLALLTLTKIAQSEPERCLDAPAVLSSILTAEETDLQVASLNVLSLIAAEYPDQVTPVVDNVIGLIDADSNQTLLAHAVDLIATLAAHDPRAVVDAVPRLAALLQESQSVESSVLTSLKRVADAYPDEVIPVVPELRAYLEDEDSPRTVAIAVLGTVAKEQPEVAESTISTVAELLDADDHKLRANAAGLLADLADEYPGQLKPLVPQVTTLLDDDDQIARYNATSILARVARAHPTVVEPAVDDLITALDAEFPHSRANACWALGYLRAESAQERLEMLESSDPHEEVRDAAGFAVDNITD